MAGRAAVRTAGTRRAVTGCSPPGCRRRAPQRRAAPAFPVAPGPPSPLHPTLPPSPGRLPKSGRGGCGEAGILVGFSLRSVLSSPRERRRGRRPEVPSEAPFVRGLRRQFAQILLEAPPGSPGPGPGAPAPRAAAGSSPPAPERPLRKRAEEHLRPADWAAHSSCVELGKQINSNNSNALL